MDGVQCVVKLALVRPLRMDVIHQPQLFFKRQFLAFQPAQCGDHRRDLLDQPLAAQFLADGSNFM